MNRTTYNQTRASIRANGLAYTTRRAIESGNVEQCAVCDFFANMAKVTDWLNLRVQFAKTTPGKESFILTTKINAKWPRALNSRLII